MKQVGATIEIDFGSGLETVPVTRLGETVTFKESLEGYGVAEATFTLFDVESPLVSATLRNRRRVRITLHVGEPGAVASYVQLEGYTRDVTYDDATRSAAITCQDESSDVSTKRVQLALAAGAGETRATVLAGVFADLGITAVVDCPGTVEKAINEAGDTPVLEFVAAFVAPAGRRAYWRGGVLHVATTDLGAPVATLKAHDIVQGSLKITPPATNTPNTIRFSAAIIDTNVVADGVTTTIEDEDGIYTPRGCVQRQNVDGTIEAHVVSPDPSSPISRKVTTVTRAGGKVTETVIDEWGWMAPFQPRAKQLAETYSESEPTLTHSGLVCYDFGDGGPWRSQEQETFQIIRRTRVIETYDGDVHTGRIATVRTHSYNRVTFGTAGPTTWESRPARGPGGFVWNWAECYLWQPSQDSERVSLVSPPPDAADVVTTGGETNEGLIPFSVFFTQPPFLAIVDAISHDFTGDISAIKRRIMMKRRAIDDSIETGYSRWEPGFPPAAGSIWFNKIAGSLSAPWHHRLFPGDPGVVEGEFVINYLPMTEATRTGHVVSVAGDGTSANTRRPIGYESEMSLPAPGSSYVVDQIIPLEDRRGLFTKTQTATASAASAVAANGAIVAYARNDYCETTTEESVAARDILRATLSPNVEMTLPIPRGDIHAGDTITLGMQGDEDVLVIGNEMTINLRKPESASQKLSCLWYLPELR